MWEKQVPRLRKEFRIIYTEFRIIYTRISNNIYRGEYLAVQKKSNLKIYYNNSVIFPDIGILNRFNFEMVAIHLFSVTASLSSTYLQLSKFYYILLDSCYFPVFYCY